MSRWHSQTSAGPYEVGRTVFTGSSTIRRWERLQQDLNNWAPIQRGFGGSILWEVVEHIDETVTSHQPSAVVIYSGSNDIFVGFEPEFVADAYRCVVERINESLGDNVSIHYISITPTPDRWASWPRANAANLLIKNIALDWPGLHFIDTTDEFLATGEPPDSSLFLSDGLHFSEKGYRIWQDVVSSRLEATVDHFPYEANGLAPGTRILIDLGPSNAEDGTPTESPDAFGQHWNNWSPIVANVLMNSGEHISNLVDSTGQPTDLRLVFAAATHLSQGIRDGGLLEPDPTLLGRLAVPTATQDYIFTEKAASDFGDHGAFTIEGLDPKARYAMRFFASRNNKQTATTRYTITGAAESSSAELQVSGAGIGHDGTYNGNDDEIVELTELAPDLSGRLHIDFVPVEQALGSFAYLSLLEIIVQ